MRNRSIATYLIAGCAGASFLYGLTFPRQLGAQGGLPESVSKRRIARPLSNTPAAHAGIQKGDLITKVDGKTVVGMTVDQVVGMIRGQPNTAVHLTIQRPGKPDPIELRIVREMVEIEVVQDVEMK